MSSLQGSLVVGPSEAANPWFSWSFVRGNAGTLLDALGQHVLLTLLTIVIGAVIAIPLGLLASRRKRLSGVILGISGLLYTIPSLAMFAILVPIFGPTFITVLIGLVAYALLLLIRNTVAGLNAVPEDVRDAARGMGYGASKMFFSVELPIAAPSILTGIRVATGSTIALVTIGAVVGVGGLGTLILAGFNNNTYRAEILTASLMCVLLAIVADVLLLTAARVALPWAKGRSL